MVAAIADVAVQLKPGVFGGIVSARRVIHAKARRREGAKARRREEVAPGDGVSPVVRRYVPAVACGACLFASSRLRVTLQRADQAGGLG
ncbi:hypothetical protein GCM10009102_01190 [Sphingomonas insulae]|uniref:Uncharacterized protein n=1 Tax=Sphingomonas insulae TaxID=424800 RepID=A0ABN1HKY9_9SPHN